MNRYRTINDCRLRGVAETAQAERLTGLIHGMDWSVFTKNGTDATTLAVPLARVKTGKTYVLMAKGAYHGPANWRLFSPS
ncbi:MAG: hypothetical protein DRP70_04260 [Spirochaetes bacterium]|nr:MAG: hypothetical protein DRP49_07745 [Spirochaetota bacterium]RKX89276.1 MAG: hypothetical protein DRP70_04260 [Spirochaetota bacterium]